MNRKTTAAAMGVALVMMTVLAGCSSASGSGSGSGSGSAASAALTPTPAGSGPTGAGSGGSSAAGSADLAAGGGATISGDLNGTVTVNLCDGTGIASIAVNADGQKYLGSASAKEFGFVGPDAKDWVTDPEKDPTLPAVSADLTTTSIEGVHVYYELPGDAPQAAVLHGTLTCP